MNEMSLPIKIVFKIKGAENLAKINEFIEKRIVPIQKKHPYAEISIEVSI